MYGIRKSFKFEAAHKLKCLPQGHPCSNIHGHSYVVTVEIQTKELDENCMVIDFGKLKVFQKWLDKKIDHTYIIDRITKDTTKEEHNTKVFIMNDYPTAEAMAKLFFREIKRICKSHNIKASKIRIEVAETVGNIAFYEEAF